MDIKDFVLKGGRLTVPYKENIEDWVGTLTLAKVAGLYGNPDFITIDGAMVKRYAIEDIDEAVAIFTEHVFGEKNVAIYLERAMEMLGVERIDSRNGYQLEVLIKQLREEENGAK